MASLLYIVVALAAVVSFYNYYWKRRKYPPGPPPLPLAGNMLTMFAGEQCFNEWAKRYGPIYTVWFGEFPVILVTDYQIMAEMFRKDGDLYIDRPTYYSGFFEILWDGLRGIILTNGKLWQEQRQFAMQTLKELGMGRNLMQEKIMDEIDKRFAWIDAHLERSDVVAISSLFDFLIGSIINNMLFGYRFDEANIDEYRRLQHLMTETGLQTGRILPQLICQYPKLAGFPIFSGVFRRIRGDYDEMHAFFAGQIDAHEAQIDFAATNDEPASDLVEAFLKEKHKRKLAGDRDHYFTKTQLISVCRDLWTAGQETTTATVSFGVAHILRHPDVQRRIHEELDRVIGDPQRVIMASDRVQLPYIDAVTHECQRIANVVPINLPRSAAREHTVRGLVIPKNAFLIPQIAALNYDERIYPEPHTFNPKHFLTADGKSAKSDGFIPFSVGRRQCPGEALARMEIFLLLANLFNRYELAPADALPSLRRQLKNIVICEPYDCRLRRRLR